MTYEIKANPFASSSLAKVKQVEREQLQDNDMDTWDSIALGVEAASKGLHHGVVLGTPETFYRATRSIAEWMGSSDWSNWASEGLADIQRERQTDPYYMPDKEIMNSSYHRAIYEGMYGVANSLTVGAPAMALTGLTAGGATPIMMALATSTGGAYGIAEYDSFIEQAQTELGLDRQQAVEMVNDKAIISAIAEGSFEAASNVIGGKLIGLIGKKAAAQASKKFIPKLLKGMLVDGVAGEVPTELATAMVQDKAREMADLSHVGMSEAVRNAIGPALVAGLGFGAVGATAQHLRPTEGAQATAPELVDPKARLDALYSESEKGRRETLYSPEANSVYDSLIEKGWDKKEAEALIAITDQFADNSGDRKTWYERKTKEATELGEQGWQQEAAMVQAFTNPEATTTEIVDTMMDNMLDKLSEEQGMAIDEFYGEDFDSLKRDLDYYIKSGRKLPKDSPIDLKEMPEFREIFTTLRDDLLTTYNRVQKSKVDISPAAQDVFNKALSDGELKVEAPKESWVKPLLDGEDLSKASVDFDFYTMDKKADFSNREELMATIDKDITAKIEEALGKGTNKHSHNTLINDGLKELEQSGLMHVQEVAKLRYGAENTEKSVAKFVMTHKALQNGANTAMEQFLETRSNADLAKATIAMEMYNAYSAEAAGLRTAMGRGLNALKMINKVNDSSSINQRLQMFAEATNPEAFALKAKMFLDNKYSLKDKLQHMENVKYTKTRSAILEYWMNSMLSHPVTHLVNTMGNGWTVTESLFNRAVGRFISDGSTGVVKGEATAAAKGAFFALHDAVNAAISAFKGGTVQRSKIEMDITNNNISGEAMGLTPEQGTLAGGLGKIVDFIGNIVNIPSRTLLGMDEFFKTVAYNSELEAIAHREATLAQEAGESYTDVYQMIKDPDSRPKSIEEKCTDFSRYVTFQSDLGRAGKAAEEFRKKVPESMFIVPFFRTGINIFDYGMARTPLLQKLTNDYKRAKASGNRADADMMEAKLLTGTMLWGTAIAMAAGGLITGGGPTDKKEREKLLATGWKPNSLKIGNTYYDINRLDPVAWFFTTAANVAEMGDAMDDEEAGEAMLAGISAAFRSISDRYYFQGISNFVNAVQDFENQGEYYISNMAGTFVPNAMKGIRKEDDEFMREVDGIVDGIRNSVWGVSSGLPIRRNYLGEPIKYTEGQAYSPVRWAEGNDDPVHKEIHRLTKYDKVTASKASKYMSVKGNRTKLTAKEYSRYLELSGLEVKMGGKNAKERLNSLITADWFQQLSDDDKGLRIDEILIDHRKLAKEQLLNESPELRKRLKINE